MIGRADISYCCGEVGNWEHGEVGSSEVVFNVALECCQLGPSKVNPVEDGLRVACRARKSLLGGVDLTQREETKRRVGEEGEQMMLEVIWREGSGWEAVRNASSKATVH